MRPIFVALVVSLLLSVGGGAALAGTKWCVVDPILTVDGRVSDVTVNFDETHLPSVLPPIVFRFHVPSNSTVSVELPPSPIAYTVAILYDLPARAKKDPVTVTAETLVPAVVRFEVHTVVLLRNTTVSVVGQSGSTTIVSYTVR